MLTIRRSAASNTLHRDTLNKFHVRPSAIRLGTYVLLAMLPWSPSIRAAMAEAVASPQSIEPRFVHLRSDDAREWSTFPEQAEGRQLEVRFAAARNEQEFGLWLRQQDVKQSWRVSLNDKPLGNLIRDESDLVSYLPIPKGSLADGENVLKIACTAREPQTSDDIRVGQLRIEQRPVREALAEGKLEIEVVDARTGEPLPARLTMVDANHSLHATSAMADEHLAVRTGVIYTANGQAQFGLPRGRYTIYAGRGFEYSLAKVELTLAAGETARRRLTLDREVSTPGYVACDTHIHTLTHSGHGDSTIAERMITLAGEGIELPIATDHNVHVDYEEHARRLGVRKHFTPVIGNEVTTSVGHFNVFPVGRDARVPDFQQKDWGGIFEEIFATPDVKIAILNHGRDIHSGTRPLGPQLFNAAIGENVAGWPMRLNAMEIINSGATQTDPLQLTRDWMAMLNCGYRVTPVGSSDSHDVTRYIVGQGRTYIRCADDDPARLDVGEACDNFLAGRVMVSYGLLTELTVNDRFGPGDLASADGDEVEVQVRVLAPHWIAASTVQLYANGQLLREETVTERASRGLPPGVKWQSRFTVPRPSHDVHLIAVARGPGIEGPYWPTAKPYQPTSADWQPQVLGVSGAVWLDGDGDDRRQSARDYAERIFADADGNLASLLAELANYDAAVSAQAADLYRTAGGMPLSDELTKALKTAAPSVQAGFRAYIEAWRENEMARARR